MYFVKENCTPNCKLICNKDPEYPDRTILRVCPRRASRLKITLSGPQCLSCIAALFIVITQLSVYYWPRRPPVPNRPPPRPLAPRKTLTLFRLDSAYTQLDFHVSICKPAWVQFILVEQVNSLLGDDCSDVQLNYLFNRHVNLQKCFCKAKHYYEYCIVYKNITAKWVFTLFI